MLPSLENFRGSRREALIVGISFVGAGGLRQVSGQDKPAPGQIVRYANPRKYAVQHSVTVTNGTSVLKSLEMWIPVPQNSHAQRVKSVRIRPKVELLSDSTGTATVAKLFKTDGLPADGESVSLKVSYRVTAREIVTDRTGLARYPYRAYRKNTTYSTFVRREKKIETDFPKIARQARCIQGDRRSAVSIARSAYDWVLERTKYQLIDGLGGAKYCLEHGHGECGDYSALFVALCRAAGVPARPVVGFWADQTNSWHVWAEFLLPTGEWIPVDPSIGDQNTRNRAYCFGNLDNRRVALCKTFDVKLQSSKPGKNRIDFLQVGAWWWYASKIGKPPSARFVATGHSISSR